MSDENFTEELHRALARPDSETILRQLNAYIDYQTSGSNEMSDDAGEVLTCYYDDPEKAFAFVILGAFRSNDANVLALLGCGPLEDVLGDPSEELLGRVVAEAQRSARFCWMLSNTFKVSIAERAWEAIEQFRVSGPHEEPSLDLLPPR